MTTATGQGVCLAMIVRNEARVIARCLRSVRPYVTHWAIVDTGSTDGTQDIIQRELTGLPGQLIESEWVDFSTNRNQSLDLARSLGCDYAFVIDADETLEMAFTKAEWGPFEADCYAIRLRMGDAVWCRRQMFRLSLPWRYVDEIHEHAECPGAGVPGQLLGWEIRSHNDSRRNEDRIAKSNADAKVLRGLLKRRPNDPRLTYYLAQTLIGAEQVDDAIELHEKRISMGGFDEEVYASANQVAALREFRGDHYEDVVAAYLRAYNIRPTRAEPLWAVAALYNDRGQPALAELYARAACRLPRPSDALVVNESVYMWRAADELAGALARLGRLDEALIILRRLLRVPELPESERPRVAENIDLIEGAKVEDEAA